MKKLSYILTVFLLILSFTYQPVLHAVDPTPVTLAKTTVRAENTVTGIRISWDPVEGVTAYRIYRKLPGEEFKQIKATTGLSYLDKTAVTNGRKYQYRIEPYKKSAGVVIGVGSSNTATAYRLRQPQLLKVTRSSSTATLLWDKNNKGTGYEIQYARKSNFSDAVSVNVFDYNTLQQKLTLPKTRNYYIRIRTVKQVGKHTSNSAWSNKCRIVGWYDASAYAANSKIHSDSVTVYYTGVVSSKRKGLTICVNAGHGTTGGSSVQTLCHPDGSPKVSGGSTAAGSIYATAINSGTTFLNGVPESEATLKVALKLKDLLLAEGYNVVMIRENSDVQLDNIARTIYANRLADVHIALHYDSSTNNKGAFYIGVPEVASYRRMKPVADHYQEHELLGSKLISGFSSVGLPVYGAGRMALDLTQTSYSTIASVDIEMGDRGSSTTAAAYKKYAQGLLAGINAYQKAIK